MSNSENTPGGQIGAPEQSVRRPFVEPEVSSPVDVVNGNPAADAFFAVVGSGGPTP